MPGGKDFQNKTVEELKQQADDEYNLQETVFDKLWYSLNLTAHYKQVSESRYHDFTPDEDDLELEFGDKLPENPVEVYLQNHPIEYFYGDETKRLKVPHDDATSDKTYEVEQHVKNRLIQESFTPKTAEEKQNCFQIQGMMMAKIALETAKEYEEKLKKIPEDDPYREEKATYLQMFDTQSKAMSLDNSLKNFIGQVSRETNLSRKMFQESPVGTADKLKNMTMKEYFQHCWSTEEDQKKYYAEKKAAGLNIDENTCAYDAFKMVFEKGQRDIKSVNPNYTVKEATDEEILSNVKEKYNLAIVTYHQRFGIEIIKSGLSEEDKKRVDRGVKMFEWKEYRPPKPIRDWAKNEGQYLAIEKRVDQLNENYEFYGKEASPTKNYGVTQTGAIGSAYDKLPENASEYDKYVHEHIGAKALIDTPAERRQHLALVMAAKAAQTSGVAFDVKKIEDFAKGVKNSYAFKNLSDKEVSQALFNKSAALETQQRILRETYEVPKEEQAEYIRKMKELSQAMTPDKGKSPKYQALCRAVSGIAAIDPNDPNVRTKLMVANDKMLNSLVDYQKGKKSMRSILTDGQQRFDNSMDALSIMNDHVPGLRPYAKAQVDRTNAVRKVGEGHKNFVDLANFGTERAKQASAINFNIHLGAPAVDIKGPGEQKPPTI